MRKNLIFLWGKNVTLDPRFAYKICRSAQITPNLSKGWVIELLVSLHRWGVHSRAWFGIRVSPKSTWTRLMSPHVQCGWCERVKGIFLFSQMWSLNGFSKLLPRVSNMEFVYVRARSWKWSFFLYKYLPIFKGSCELISNWRAKHPRHFHPQKKLSHFYGSQKY